MFTVKSLALSDEDQITSKLFTIVGTDVFLLLTILFEIYQNSQEPKIWQTISGRCRDDNVLREYVYIFDREYCGKIVSKRINRMDYINHDALFPQIINSHFTVRKSPISMWNHLCYTS